MIIVELLVTVWARNSHSSGTPHDCGGPVATCACLYNNINFRMKSVTITECNSKDGHIMRCEQWR